MVVCYCTPNGTFSKLQSQVNTGKILGSISTLELPHAKQIFSHGTISVYDIP